MWTIVAMKLVYKLPLATLAHINFHPDMRFDRYKKYEERCARLDTVE